MTSIFKYGWLPFYIFFKIKRRHSCWSISSSFFSHPFAITLLVIEFWNFIFRLKILWKVLNKCQSSDSISIRFGGDGSLLVYRWQTFITANNGNMLQLVCKSWRYIYHGHTHSTVCKPLIWNYVRANSHSFKSHTTYAKHMHAFSTMILWRGFSKASNTMKFTIMFGAL